MPMLMLRSSPIAASTSEAPVHPETRKSMSKTLPKIFLRCLRNDRMKVMV